MSYQDFLARKALVDVPTGIENPPELSAKLKEHQRLLTSWALRRGRAAIFADTGLGKGWMLLEWARVVAEHTGKPVLILAPLAVSQQFMREAGLIWPAPPEQSPSSKSFIGTVGSILRGLPPINLCAEQSDVAAGVNVTNYQKLHKFDVSAFGGVALDEASILKSFDGSTRKLLTQACRSVPFRLAATATPSPNDHTELGGQAEFLGVMSHAEMLATFFVHDGGSTQDWRLKGHAREAFWRWVCSWGAIVKKPSDLGCSDEGYALPPLRYHEHIIPATTADARKSGMLFAEPAETLAEQRVARRSTIDSRTAIAARLAIGNEWAQGQSTTAPTTKSDTTATRSIGPSGSLSDLELQKKTESTCESTTSETSIAGPSEPQRSGPSTTPTGESSTPPTRQRERSSKRARANIESSIRSEHSRRTSESSGSLQKSSNGSSQSKVEGAQSAGEPNHQISEKAARSGDFTSTTVTPADASADCSVPPATWGSDNSETTPAGCNEPSTTSGAADGKCIIWCELNDEQDAVAAALGDRCVSVYGSLSDDEKVSRYERWARGDVPYMVSKVTIFGFGLNMQFCRRVVFVGATNSFEQFYQGVRRCWRFGQERAVDVHVVASELEGRVVENLKEKQRKADELTAETSQYVRQYVRAAVGGSVRETLAYEPKKTIAWPKWLRRETA